MINFYKIIIKFKFCVKLPNFIYLSIKDFNNYVGNYINIIIYIYNKINCGKLLINIIIFYYILNIIEYYILYI